MNNIVYKYRHSFQGHICYFYILLIACKIKLKSTNNWLLFEKKCVGVFQEINLWLVFGKRGKMEHVVELGLWSIAGFHMTSYPPH